MRTRSQSANSLAAFPTLNEQAEKQIVGILGQGSVGSVVERSYHTAILAGTNGLYGIIPLQKDNLQFMPRLELKIWRIQKLLECEC